MPLYCLCQLVPEKDGEPAPHRNQLFGALNRILPDEKELYRVFLRQRMQVVVNGVPQYVRNNSMDNIPPNTVIDKKTEEQDLKLLADCRQHFRNVDLYRCPHCGAVIVLE